MLINVDSFLAMAHLLSKSFGFDVFVDQGSKAVEDQDGKLNPFRIGTEIP